MSEPTQAEIDAFKASQPQPAPAPAPKKPRLEDASFYKLHKILESRPNDRALRVDRPILEGMMVEIIAAAKRIEKVQAAFKAIAPAVDFTDDESPQDTILSLLKECRDSVYATTDEDGISDQRKAYRKELVGRINAVIGEAPEAPAGQ